MTKHRELAHFGVFKFLDFLGVLETWFGRLSETHPHAINRLANLKPLLSIGDAIEPPLESLSSLYRRGAAAHMAAIISTHDPADVTVTLENLAALIGQQASREGPSYLPPYYPPEPKKPTSAGEKSASEESVGAPARPRWEELDGPGDQTPSHRWPSCKTRSPRWPTPMS